MANSMVENWLQSLGHLEYTQSFIDNGYDEIEICKQIGVADLDAIGVLNSKHRKSILDGVNNLCQNVDVQKPMYFILENPQSPSFYLKKTCTYRDKTPHSNSSSVTSSLSSKSHGISSSSSGISVHISNSSHENSIDSEGENHTQVYPNFIQTNSALNSDSGEFTRPFNFMSNLKHKRYNDTNEFSRGDGKTDNQTDSFEIEELDSAPTSVSSSLKSSTKANSSSSMEDLGQRLSRIKVENSTLADDYKSRKQCMRPSTSYTSGCYGMKAARVTDWRNAISAENSGHMISAYGHSNRSVPPPLPRCPPPSNSCTDMVDTDTLVSLPTYENRCKRQSCNDLNTPRTSTLNSQYFPHSDQITPWPACTTSRCPSSSSSEIQNNKSIMSSKGSSSSLRRMFSFRKSNNSIVRKTCYKPPAGDLSAHEITMCDEDRIRLMVMVKEGTLSMHEALATVKQYELEKKKGINKKLNYYLNGDSIKIPVSPDKSSKPSPFSFLRSFSFRSSKRRKLLHDLEYYYKEQEKRQKAMRDRMAAVEAAEDNTYSRPQCCSNKSCDQSGMGNCRNSSCMLTNRLCTSPTGTQCDTHLYCYGTCSKAMSSDIHTDNIGGCGSRAYMDSPTRRSVSRSSSFRQSPIYKPTHVNRSCSECNPTTPTNCGGYYGMHNDASYFNRTYGGRHSFHGVPSTRRHSDVITFVHHVQSSSVPPAVCKGEVCDGCQDHGVYESNHGTTVPCSMCPSGVSSSSHRCHRNIVTNSIAEEHSPCISSSSSTEDIHIGIGAMSVQASVHRSDIHQNEDNLNNNSPIPVRIDNYKSSVNCIKPVIPDRPDSSISGSSEVSQHSLSTESELPIEQYKPKKHMISPLSTRRSSITTAQQDKVNIDQMNRENANIESSHQENYAQTSVLVKNNGAPQTVQELCNKLSLEHLLPTFLDNGFETLELFKQLDDDDLTILGITSVTDRAKVLTAVTLLPDEEEYGLPSYTYKSLKNTGIYSKVGQSNKVNSINHKNDVNITVPAVLPDPNHNLPVAVLGRNSPAFNGALPTRDSGCYMEQLNSSAQSQG